MRDGIVSKPGTAFDMKGVLFGTWTSFGKASKEIKNGRRAAGK
jgi:hypothetical protein